MSGKRFNNQQQLFHAALERPAGERENWLVEQCGEDIELLNRVRELLLQHGRDAVSAESCASSIDSQGQETPESLTATLLEDGDANHPASSLEGIERYRIDGLLDEGQYGQVYLGFDEQLKRPVAIKVPRLPESLSTNEQEDFRHEARMLASLRHQNLISVFDFGITAKGEPYVVTEFIEGNTLQKERENREFSADQAAELVAQIASALHEAHKQGIVHRDVKPANIILDANGRPHLADFGLAFHESEQSRYRNQLSGSPSYMAPEQVRRLTHHLDGRTDIWAAGVILYELLTKRKPFPAKNQRELFEEIQNRDPKPPRMIDESIPVELETIVLKCLEKQPADRYSSAFDLAEALRGWIAAQPIPAASARTELDRSDRKRQWTVQQYAIVVLIAAGGIFLLTRINQDSPARTPPHAGGNGTAHAAADASAPADAAGGSVSVVIWDPDDERRQGLALDQRGALPLQAGDQFRVEAEVDRPMYLYLVWIQPDGSADPIYPWTPGDWESRPVGKEGPEKKVSLPEKKDRGWTIVPTGGRDTVLLLARETPLPDGFDLRDILTDFPVQSVSEAAGLVVFDQDTPDKLRGADFSEDSIDDPVLKAGRFLQDRLAPHFDLIRAVSFANQSE